MKEKLYTIPMNDAINANEECPFCYIERLVEQDLLDFVLGSGSSYMESDVRELTDKAGFCRTHFKKMFDYGNTLGNGWILKTHYMRMNTELHELFAKYTPGKRSLKDKLCKSPSADHPIAMWTRQKAKSCYICEQYEATYKRYLDTFFVLYHKDESFRDKVKKSKGFCLPHFGDLCETASEKLPDAELQSFYPEMFDLMGKNMARLQEDVSWLVDKFDYRNKDADWKSSKDAIQRGMQKLKGGYPADSPYRGTHN